ncbi:MAG: helix-turn-helix transcriptional regulator [Phycisphaerae bacterium]
MSIAVLFDVAAVAEALAIGERTLWRWISMGVFPKADVSRGMRYRRWKQETVEEWMESQKPQVKRRR